MAYLSWYEYRKDWENKLMSNHDEILRETKMSYEQIREVIEVLVKYEVIPND